MNRILMLGIFIILIPSFAVAATGMTPPALAHPLEISGWIPYWNGATSTLDAISHMQEFDTIMPFAYIVQDDGSVYDAFGFNTASVTPTTTLLLATAKSQNVKVIPTILWNNPEAIDALLSSGPKRRAFEDRIAALVKDNNFDGIDIDFENKLVRTRPYFSLFLEGLSMRMEQKSLYCTIQPRTPAVSAFEVVPKNLVYADNYVAINTYCDRVEIMTYDQGDNDLALNAAAHATPYIPIADLKWVEKVVSLTSQFISKNKIVIGVATYGREYILTPLIQDYRYDFRWAFNPHYAQTLMTELGLTPTRNSAGELSFVYLSTTTPVTATSTPLRIVWWSDAQAIAEKIDLAKRLGVRGIAIFKIDGEEDPALWEILKK